MTTVHYPAVVDTAGELRDASSLPSKGRKVSVTLDLDENLLAAIDEVAADRGEFLADAAREKLVHRWKQEGRWDPSRPYPYFGLA